MLHLALKCDLRDDHAVQERLSRYGSHTVQYEEGLAVARRIRASRYLGMITLSASVIPSHDATVTKNAVRSIIAESTRYFTKLLECPLVHVRRGLDTLAASYARFSNLIPVFRVLFSTYHIAYHITSAFGLFLLWDIALELSLCLARNVCTNLCNEIITSSCGSTKSQIHVITRIVDRKPKRIVIFAENKQLRKEVIA